MRATGSKGLQIQVVDQRAKARDKVDEEERDPDRQQLVDGLDRFGGASSLKIYRRDVAGTEAYVGTLSVTPELLENLEEILSERWGGGTFQCKGCLKGQIVKCVTVAIDSKAFAPKASDHEQRLMGLREGNLQPPQLAPAPPLDERRVEEIIARAVASVASAIQPRRDDGLMRLLLEDRQSLHALMLERARGGSAPAGTGDLVSQIRQLTETQRLIEELGGGRAAGDDASPKRQLGRAALERVLDKVADKAGDRIGDAIGRRAEAELIGDGGAPAAAPARALQPAVPPSGAAAPSSAPGASAAAPAPGGTALSAEQLEALRKRRGFVPAPTVREAFPEAAAEDKK